MVPADGKAVAIAAEKEDVDIGPGEADAGSERDCAAMDEMRAVRIDEIGKPGGTADARQGDELSCGKLAFLEDFIKGGEQRRNRRSRGTKWGDRPRAVSS